MCRCVLNVDSVFPVLMLLDFRLRREGLISSIPTDLFILTETIEKILSTVDDTILGEHVHYMS